MQINITLITDISTISLLHAFAQIFKKGALPELHLTLLANPAKETGSALKGAA
ncbi:hypothetical protein AAF134_04475 [Synechococcus lacustris Tous-12m]